METSTVWFNVVREFETKNRKIAAEFPFEKAWNSKAELFSNDSIAISSLIFIGDGMRPELIIGDESGRISAVTLSSRNSKSSKTLFPAVFHFDTINEISQIHKSCNIITVSDDGVCKKISRNQGASLSDAYVECFHGHAGPIKSVSTLRDITSIFLTGSSDGTIRLWDTRSNIPEVLKVDAKSPVSAARFHPCNTNFAFVSFENSDKAVKVWDLRLHGTCHKNVTFQWDLCLENLCDNKQSNNNADFQISYLSDLWAPLNEESQPFSNERMLPQKKDHITLKLNSNEVHDYRFKNGILTWSKFGAYSTNHLKRKKASDKRCRFTAKSTRSGISYMDFSPHGRYLITATGEISFWDAYFSHLNDGSEIVLAHRAQDPNAKRICKPIIFGNRYVRSCSDGSIRVFNIDSKRYYKMVDSPVFPFEEKFSRLPVVAMTISDQLSSIAVADIGGGLSILH